MIACVLVLQRNGINGIWKIKKKKEGKEGKEGEEWGGEGRVGKGSVLRNWLTQLWKLVSPQSTGQASRLEMQGRVNAAVLSLKVIWKQNSFYGVPQSFLLRPSTGWMRPDHITDSKPHYSRSTDLNINHI